mmetsp:Transcript_1574/g.5474  ORF Transcript_1574/g.5474 Transcript_1574/m.5474 type:complete len:127 (+) Transcript_1574:82-462(+)
MTKMDPVLVTNSAMWAGWGTLTMAAPKKAAKIYFNMDAPSKETVGITRWVGWGYIAQAGSMLLIDKYGDDKLKKSAKTLQAVANGVGIAQIWYQTEKNGYDKTQAVVSTAVMGGVMAANIADVVKE